MQVRTRFAPSPTGYLHLGGARTALFSFLYAKRHGGEFVLRIEDTDRERSTPEAVQAILDGMNWLGMPADEGPFYQTKHMDRYKAVIQQLLDEGKAYYCNCSKERLDAMRTEQMNNKQKPRYDGHCRDLNLSADTPDCVVRFRNPTEGTVVFDDLVHGRIEVSNQELDDLIIARSDGTPTYNFTVVVDDMDMNITHVLRGDDHINNTPRQINILKALGAPVPYYGHLPMINGPDGKKLSKRHGAVSVMAYRSDGYLRETMINALARLGWSHGDQEIFSEAELIKLFDLDHVNKSAASFSWEKLQWLNQHYLKELPVSKVVTEFEWHLTQANIDYTQGSAPKMAVEALRDRCKTLVEMVDKARFLYADVQAYNETACNKHLNEQTPAIIRYISQALEQLTQWNKDTIHEVVQQTLIEFDLKMPKLAQPLRIALTGDTTSPSIDVTIELVGRERCLVRLARFADYLANR